MPSAAAVDMNSLRAMAEALTQRYPGPRDAPVAIIDVSRQRLYLFEPGHSVTEYAVSTAARGIGNRMGSEQTPLGVFRVAEKFGAGAPLGTVFKGRRATGEIAPILRDPDASTENDLVTTRILWLCGLQPGFNQGGEVDTYARYIYIHGTPEEGRIGRAVSHGCVRMINVDVVELYARMPEGSLVCIVPGDAVLFASPKVS